jgi:hypothetical protein
MIESLLGSDFEKDDDTKATGGSDDSISAHQDSHMESMVEESKLIETMVEETSEEMKEVEESESQAMNCGDSFSVDFQDPQEEMDSKRGMKRTSIASSTTPSEKFQAFKWKSNPTDDSSTIATEYVSPSAEYIDEYPPIDFDRQSEESVACSLEDDVASFVSSDDVPFDQDPGEIPFDILQRKAAPTKAGSSGIVKFVTTALAVFGLGVMVTFWESLSAPFLATELLAETMDLGKRTPLSPSPKAKVRTAFDTTGSRGEEGGEGNIGMPLDLDIEYYIDASNLDDYAKKTTPSAPIAEIEAFFDGIDGEVEDGEWKETAWVKELEKALEAADWV